MAADVTLRTSVVEMEVNLLQCHERSNEIQR